MFRPWEKVEDKVQNQCFAIQEGNMPLEVECNDTDQGINKKQGKKRSSTYNQLDLNSVISYIIDNMYPSHITTKNEKSNFRKQCRPYTVDEKNKLFYMKKVRSTSTQTTEEKLIPVVQEESEQKNIISKIHQGTDSSVESISLSGHRGRDAVLSLIQSRFYWPNMYSDVVDFIKSCNVCQKVNPGSLKAVSELQSVPVPTAVMQQIGVDIATLPEVNGKKYIIVAIDYFSKWSEIKAVENKTAGTVARFLFELICRHSCMSIQINDQGREFVNQVSTRLHELTGAKQRVTSAYHPQSNGLVERHNRTIKNMLLKTLYKENNVDKWPEIIDGVLFAHRSVRHETTKYSPFFLLYNREPKLPVDVEAFADVEDTIDDMEIKIPKEQNIIEMSTNDVFDELTFENRLKQILHIQNYVFSQTEKNILRGQEKQRKSFKKRHSTKPNFTVGDLVLLRNCVRDDRKGGWSKAPYTGPYTIIKIQKNYNCILQNMRGKLLKKSHPISNLKKYVTKALIKKSHKKRNLGKKSEIKNMQNSKTNIDTTINTHLNEDFKLNTDIKLEKCSDLNNFENQGNDIDLAHNIIYITNPDKNAQIAKFTPGLSIRSKFRFRPINQKWQKVQCEELGLIYVGSEYFKASKNSILHPPVECYTTEGDGNCFFRCISVCITGTQEQHQEIRKIIVEYMKKNKKKVDDYSGTKNYLQKSKMCVLATWATDKEISFAANLLGVDIYTYTSNIKGIFSWARFSSTFTKLDEPNYNKMAIYMYHKNLNHYDVVIKVKKQAQYYQEDEAELEAEQSSSSDINLF